ncbi:hypothetical protein LOTGIDRAFT_135845 [Lottia gigantea]|uniref:Phospholipase A2 domain-containing protein n=1 Tax=Lottia gigantea TaxID=225164 RepID=V4CQA7_LOTGI|nr:hypothetical protein LOTGIDRAFT_135845 [Lottia gigantea]ESP04645.1 hypothetical protein LOTGIDRAFT_135845 [Lottia gigantea]
MPVVTKCCDKHDICYDTCNENKENCDDQFRVCLQQVCRKVKDVFSTDAYNGNICESTADMMYTGVFGLGCKSFKDSQKNACLCPEEKSNQRARRSTEL